MLYSRKLNINDANDSNAVLYKMVSEGSRVLDVGCACGDLAELLTKGKNCLCTGMEYDPEGIACCAQKRVFERLLSVDLNFFAASDYSDLAGYFDYIVCGDVLEHLQNPYKLLQELKHLLQQGGSFVISLPNAAHASIKASLLSDEWEYAELGIMDKTHLRFFTYLSIARFLGEAGLRISEAAYTLLPAEGYQKYKLSDLPLEVAGFIAADPHSYVFQYIVKAEVSTEKSSGLIISNRKKLDIEKLDKKPDAGIMFKIKRFLLIKLPGVIKYIQKLRGLF